MSQMIIKKTKLGEFPYPQKFSEQGLTKDHVSLLLEGPCLPEDRLLTTQVLRKRCHDRKMV